MYRAERFQICSVLLDSGFLYRVGYQPVNDLYPGPGDSYPGGGNDLYPGAGTGMYPTRYPGGGNDLYPGPGAGMFPTRYFTSKMIVWQTLQFIPI